MNWMIIIRTLQTFTTPHTQSEAFQHFKVRMTKTGPISTPDESDMLPFHPDLIGFFKKNFFIDE